VADVLLLLQEHLPKFDSVVDVREFLGSPDYLLDPLPRDQIEEGFRDLEEGGAIDLVGGRVTELGKLMKELYFDVEYVALVFNGIRYGVAADCVLLVALYRSGSPFLQDEWFDAGDRLRLVDVKRACCGGANYFQTQQGSTVTCRSDVLAKANAVKAWRQSNLERWRSRAAQQRSGVAGAGGIVHADRSRADLEAEAQWCWDHYLDLKKLREIEDICSQVAEVLRRMQLVPEDFHLECVQRDSLERRTRDAKWSDVRHRSYAYKNIAEAQREIVELLGRAERERGGRADLAVTSAEDDASLVLWCLALSFPNQVFESESFGVATQLTYTVRNPGNQRRRNRRNGGWSAEQRLRNFLESKMKFSVESVQLDQGQRGGSGTQDFLVNFSTVDDAHRARQLRDSTNYTKVDTGAGVVQRRACYGSDLRILLPADTVCDLFGRNTIVCAETTATGNVVLCHEVSVLPVGCGTAALAASRASFPHCEFRGQPQNMASAWMLPRDERARGLAQEILAELDAEFRLPLARRGGAVKARRDKALQILQHFRAVAKAEGGTLRAAAARSTRLVETFALSTLHRGRCPDRNATGEIIGKQGSNVRALQDQTGCQISVRDGQVTLSGTRAAIDNARTGLERCIEDAVAKYRRFQNGRVDHAALDNIMAAAQILRNLRI